MPPFKVVYSSAPDLSFLIICGRLWGARPRKHWQHHPSVMWQHCPSIVWQHWKSVVWKHCLSAFYVKVVVLHFSSWSLLYFGTLPLTSFRYFGALPHSSNCGALPHSSLRYFGALPHSAKMFTVFYRNPGHDGSLYDCLLDSMARVHSVNDKAVFVFVGDANAHHSEWLESVSPTDRHAWAWCSWFLKSVLLWAVASLSHSHCRWLDFVMTDVPDIVDAYVSTPLGLLITALSVVCFGLSILKYNIRSTVFLKHRTNWENVRCAVRSFTWNTILKSVDPLDVFDRAIGEVIGIGLFLPLFCVVDLDTSNGLMPAAGDLMMLSRLLIMLDT